MTKFTLTPEEQAAARRLWSIWLSKKRELVLTQVKAAERLGYSSQGSVHQDLHGGIPLNTNAVLAWAKLLGVEPEEIYPELHEKFAALGPVRAQFDQEEVVLTRDEFEWVICQRKLPQHQQQVISQMVAALVSYNQRK